ncbi:integrase [Gossypium australe]|uniref:Integrase n=1 Tax=Gossypium australe TaxID=47621 RepID=A0A5B6VNI8_9ROSI|nr:integrase [Gossypium australe]
MSCVYWSQKFEVFNDVEGIESEKMMLIMIWLLIVIRVRLMWLWMRVERSFSSNDDGSILVELRTKPLFLQRIRELQNDDMNIGDDGTLYYHDRICVPNNLVLKRDILSEDQSSTYYINPSSTKICTNGKHVIVEDQVPSGLLQPVMIPEWM